ncbi:MAG: glycerophosphodiester phosphodiesterase family protein [Bacteroidota bacterium]|jgi:glycerophosphoryl diester phosphodiesterase
MRKTFLHPYPYIAALLLLISCSQDNVTAPEFSAGGKLARSLPLESGQIRLLNGVYDVLSGSDRLGKTAVVKSSGSTLSIFTGKNAGLFVLQCGRIDSSMVFEGYWRYTQSSETGLVRFEIAADNGGTSLLSGTAPTTSSQFHGILGDGTGEPSIPVTLQFNRPLKDTTFTILAHRGGGRNSDRLPASENSLGMMQIAEGFGANGIEIDVRLTKDGIPIIFHDENFSPRLVNGEYCIGPVANYSFAAIRSLCTLKNGEPVPTLKEALDVVIAKTTLRTVWLDLKSPAVIPAAAAIQQEYKQKAAAAGRTVEILLGLSSEELVDAYTKANLPQPADALCELSVNDVRNVNAKVWAPRWTLGPLPAEAGQMKAEGRKTFVWTLDQKEFILPFLTDGKVDGILTNYPALVAFEYYALQ